MVQKRFSLREKEHWKLIAQPLKRIDITFVKRVRRGKRLSGIMEGKDLWGSKFRHRENMDYLGY